MRHVTKQWLARRATKYRQYVEQCETMRGNHGPRYRSPSNACHSCGHRFEVGNLFITNNQRRRNPRCTNCAVRLHFVAQEEVDAAVRGSGA